MRVSSKKIITGLGCTLIAAAVGLTVSTYVFVNSDKVCKGVYIVGVDLSGMRKQQAGDILQKMAQSRMNGRISISVLDQKWSAAASDLGVKVDWHKSLEDAMQVGRRSNILTRLTDILSGPTDSKQIPLAMKCDESVLRRTIIKMANVIDRPAKNASLDLSSGSISVLPEQDGIKLDREASADSISKALTTGTAQISLSPVVDKAKVTASALQSVDTVLASYTTTFVRAKRDRSHNLKVASDKVNKTILMPGEEFSYNKTVGERLISTGFRNAIIFVKGMMEEGVGGGICQVSSTLYNAALLAGLDITERHHHSRTVVYVPAGRDATVAYGSRDLRFKNSGSSPIYITETITGNRLRAVIYGASADKKTVSVYNGQTSYTPINGQKTVVDRTIPPGTTKVTDKGSKGVSTVVYRKIVDETGQPRVEVVSRDKYPAQKVIVATNPVAAAPALPKPEPVVN